MEVLYALIAAIIFAVVLRRPIQALPWLFYILALGVTFLYASKWLYGVNPVIARETSPYVTRCLFAFGLFAVVMFIGVFKDGSRISKYLTPIRGELSIIAAILTCGHIFNYLSSYIDQFLTGFVGMKDTMVFSFILSALIAIMLMVLGVTSFNVIRKRMNKKRWKRIQWFAYPFFIMVYIHLMLLLAPTASVGGKSFYSVVIYTIVFGIYLIARIYRAVRDSQDKLKKVPDRTGAIRTIADYKG